MEYERARDPQVRIIVGRLEDFTASVIKKLTLDITSNLIEDTPVDTGWARANWVPAIGLPYLEDLAFVGDTREDRQAEVPGASTRQQQGMAQVATSYKLRNGSVFISNNVPYIVLLNEGTSAQAPQAFVQTAIQRGIVQVGRTKGR